MLNYKKLVKKILVGAAAISLVTTPVQTHATDWSIFNFYLYPDESAISNTTSSKNDTRGYGQLKSQTMAGGGSHKIIYSIQSGGSQISQSVTVTAPGTAQIPYNNTPGSDAACKLKGKVPNTQSAPLRVEGTWTS